MKIFLTGGSGFLGAALLPFFVEDRSVETIYLLLRGSAKETAEQRLVTLIDKVFAPDARSHAARKIKVAVGDLTLENMGFDAAACENLARECTHILHVGASTDFGAPLEESRWINVEGTRRVLDLATTIQKLTGKLERFDYVSTAFVAGTRTGLVTENMLARGQGFANSYEQSKYEAELLVRDYQTSLPIAIHRPSIVVGDSRNGFTPHFKVLYWPLQLLAKNLLPFIPCNTKATLDIVPVDFVAKSIYRLMMTPQSIGQTFHLTAGKDSLVPIKHFLRDAFRYTTIRRRPTVPLWIFKVIRTTMLRRLMSEDFWKTCELAAVYSEYLSGNAVIFDNQKTLAVLKSLNVAPPPLWRAYSHKILNYCTQTRWGRKLDMQEYLYRNPRPALS